MATKQYYNQQPNLDDINEQLQSTPRPPRRGEPQRVEIVMPAMPQAIKSGAGLLCEALALVCRLLELACELLGMVGRIVDTVFGWCSHICDKCRRYLIGVAHNL